MSDELTAARELCAAAGIADAPRLLLLAVAGIRGAGRRRELLATTTAEQLRRMRLSETWAGRLDLLIDDTLAGALDDLKRARILRRTREEL